MSASRRSPVVSFRDFLERAVLYAPLAADISTTPLCAASRRHLTYLSLRHQSPAIRPSIPNLSLGPRLSLPNPPPSLPVLRSRTFDQRFKKGVAIRRKPAASWSAGAKGAGRAVVCVRLARWRSFAVRVSSCALPHCLFSGKRGSPSSSLSRSPDWCICRRMSEPPTNSPLMKTWGMVGQCV